MAVVAFVVMFTQAEGCGEHVAHITDLQLAPDGQTLAVARADARVFYGDHRRHINNLWLTHSLMNAERGTVVKVLESRTSRGIGGEIRSARCTPTFSFSQQHLYFPSHDYELVCYQFDGRQRSKVALPGGVACVAVSSDEQHLLYADLQTGTAILISTDDRKVLWQKAVQGIGARYLGCALAFSGGRFAALDYQELKYGNLSTKVQYKTKTILKNMVTPRSVHLVKSNSRILVAFEDFFDLIDVETGQTERVKLELVGRSGDGRRLVVESADGLQLIDLETGERSRAVPLDFYAAIACLSNDGQRLFIGDYYGRITCVDPITGKRLWSSTAPGHFRPGTGWLIFLVVASLWGWRRYNRRQHRIFVERLSSSARGQPH